MEGRPQEGRHHHHHSDLGAFPGRQYAHRPLYEHLVQRDKVCLDYVYDRTAGTAGFAGTWDSDSVQVNSVFEFQIEPYEEDGLSFISPAEQTIEKLKFDGKDYPGSGPSLPKGITTSGHRVSELTMQLTDKIAGKIMDTRQVDVSTDLKTLTMTVRTVNHNKPNILVFERE